MAGIPTLAETIKDTNLVTMKVLVDGNAGSNILNLPMDKLMQGAHQDDAADNVTANQSAVNLASAQANETSTSGSNNSDQSVGTEVK